jgi:hypothetical protein
MAVNVDIVYKTVLSILNKEQRGYITPSEFNKIATQVQLEIFNEYFNELSQQLRIPDNDSEYADHVKEIQEKISVFERDATCTIPVGTDYFQLTTTPNTVYRLGTVIYNNEIEVQQVQSNELLKINLSKLTKPTTEFPIFEYKNYRLYVYPKTITNSITATYLKKPSDPIWGFTVGTRGQYIYNPSAYSAGPPATGSRDFELHEKEQNTIILKVLMYSGVIIQNPQIVQMAAQQVQAEQINSKS